MDSDINYVCDGRIIRKLARLMCQWNRHLWAGRENQLLNMIWNLFEKECHKECERERRGGRYNEEVIEKIKEAALNIKAKEN